MELERSERVETSSYVRACGGNPRRRPGVEN